MKKHISIAFSVLLLVASSCASRKKTVVPPQSQAFEWMTASLNIQAEGNGLTFSDLSGQIRMRNDSLVWFSVTATMGVEVMRAKISTDSVWVINRLDKTYLAEPMDTLAAQLGRPISLPLVQCLLMDNNEGLPPVENQMVMLKTFLMGDMSAKIKYNNIKLNEPTTFPLKITNKMERFRLKKKGQ